MRLPHLLFFLSLLPLIMGSWFPTAFSSVLTVLETAATVGVGMICPPLAPIVGGALAIGGALLENEVNKEFDQAKEAHEETVVEGQSGVSEDAFNDLTWRLEDLKESVDENREFILFNQEEIRQNREEIFTNRNLIMDNTESIAENKDLILDNRDLLEDNKNILLDNKKSIRENKGLILDNKKDILDNKNILLDNKKSIRENKGLILDNKKYILDNKNFILANKDSILKNRKITLQNQNLLNQNKDMLIGVQGMINKTALENREFMSDLSKSLEAFEFNMNQNFDQLKDFMVAQTFVKDVVMKMDGLWDKMEEATKKRSNRTIQDFLRLNQLKGHALDFLEEATKSLDSQFTNPIISAMFAFPLQSRGILDHYMRLFSNLVVKTMAIEGFYYGLTDNRRRSTKENMKALQEKIDQSINIIRDFLIEVTISKDKYWPTQVEQTIRKLNVGTDVAAVADNIKETLDGLYTKDVFNIFAFRCQAAKTCEPTLLLNASLANSQQKIMVNEFNKATRVRVIVLRSEHHSTASLDDTLTLKSGFRSYKMLMERWKQNPCDKAPFEAMVNDMVDLEASPLNGFLICNVEDPGAARITNQETAIIEDQDMSGDEKFYYGLSWD